MFWSFLIWNVSMILNKLHFDLGSPLDSDLDPYIDPDSDIDFDINNDFDFESYIGN